MIAPSSSMVTFLPPSLSLRVAAARSTARGQSILRISRADINSLTAWGWGWMQGSYPRSRTGHLC